MLTVLLVCPQHQVSLPSGRWAAAASPPSLPRPSEGVEGGWATSAPCPPPPSSSTAERSPQNGRAQPPHFQL